MHMRQVVQSGQSVQLYGKVCSAEDMIISPVVHQYPHVIAIDHLACVTNHKGPSPAPCWFTLDCRNELYNSMVHKEGPPAGV